MIYYKILQKKTMNIAIANSNKIIIVIFLHLYNFSQLDEWAKNINYCYDSNKHNDIHLYINIPIGDNLNEVNCSPDEELKSTCKLFDYQECLNDQNIHKVKKIISLCVQKFRQTPIFMVSKNKGVDIGGFFQFINIIKKENIKFDFLLKAHTKSEQIWRENLAKLFRKTFIKNEIEKYDLIGTMIFTYPGYKYEKETNEFHLKNICNTYKIKFLDTFRFVPGTIFMCSYKLIIELSKINLEEAYDNLNDFYSIDINWVNIMKNDDIFQNNVIKNKIDDDSNKYTNLGNNFALMKLKKTGIRDGMKEHAWERIFGLIAENLGGNIKRF